MTVTPKSHIKLALQSIDIFMNDGTLDASELRGLIATAMVDGQIDEQEKSVLLSIFNQAEKTKLTPDVEKLIDQIKTRHGIK